MSVSNDIEDTSFIAKTLEWCNGVRAGKGLEPLAEMPKGRQNDPVSCPCGKAAGVWVDRLFYVDMADGEDKVRHALSTYERSQRELHPAARIEVPPFAKMLPPAVQEFVTFFDMGRMPEYDAEREYQDEGL